MYDVHVNIISIQGLNHLLAYLVYVLIEELEFPRGWELFSLCTLTPFTEKNLGGRCLCSSVAYHFPYSMYANVC